MYQGAFEAVIAFLVAALFGYWLDGYFDTTPVLLLVGIVIGFASLTVRLIRLGRWVEEESNPNNAQSSKSTNENENEK